MFPWPNLLKQTYAFAAAFKFGNDQERAGLQCGVETWVIMMLIPGKMSGLSLRTASGEVP